MTSCTRLGTVYTAQVYLRPGSQLDSMVNFSLLIYTMFLHRNVSQTFSLHSREAPPLWIHMASWLTTLTSHVRMYTGWQCAYCWYLSHKRDLSLGTLEHQTLHAGLVQSNLPDSILKNNFPQNWQNNPSEGCWEGAFSCLKRYSNL